METISDIKKDFPHIKILVISGGGIGDAQTYLKFARKLGVNATLDKPFVKQKLFASIQEIFDEK